MKKMIERRWSLVCLLLLFLGGQVAAQEEVVTYLNVSEPVISQMQSNIRDFLNEVQPLRQQKDIAGVKKVADKYILIWDDQLDNLAQITPPAEAETHYQALKRLLELQRESNQIMSETLAQRLALLMQIQQMTLCSVESEVTRADSAVCVQSCCAPRAWRGGSLRPGAR